jgi:hypothetical protein
MRFHTILGTASVLDGFILGVRNENPSCSCV